MLASIIDTGWVGMLVNALPGSVACRPVASMARWTPGPAAADARAPLRHAGGGTSLTGDIARERVIRDAAGRQPHSSPQGSWQ